MKCINTDKPVEGKSLIFYDTNSDIWFVGYTRYGLFYDQRGMLTQGTSFTHWFSLPFKPGNTDAS